MKVPSTGTCCKHIFVETGNLCATTLALTLAFLGNMGAICGEVHCFVVQRSHRRQMGWRKRYIIYM